MAKTSKPKVPWTQIGTAAVAAAVGGIVGVLFAPQSGKKTRDAIASEGKKLAKDATKLAKKAQSEAVKALPKKAILKKAVVKKATKKK